MPSHAARGYDYVVIARPETLLRPFEALVGDLLLALGRLGLDREGVPSDQSGGPARMRRPKSTSHTQSGAVKE